MPKSQQEQTLDPTTTDGRQLQRLFPVGRLVKVIEDAWGVGPDDLPLTGRVGRVTNYVEGMYDDGNVESGPSPKFWAGVEIKFLDDPTDGFISGGYDIKLIPPPPY